MSFNRYDFTTPTGMFSGKVYEKPLVTIVSPTVISARS